VPNFKARGGFFASRRRVNAGIGVWVAFNIFVLAMVAIDLGVFHRKAHVVKLREAGIWVGVWVALALILCGVIYVTKGSTLALEFITGYIVEQSLSVDNLFVFITIFGYFGVPSKYQHRVLLWGIIGALVMRGSFVAVGSFLIHQFAWVLYLFGGLLIVTGIRMLYKHDDEFDGETNRIVRMARHFIPISPVYDGQRFFVRAKSGKLMATPLFLTLLLVEFSDILFAVDSIPAVFGITQDPFIVYTATIMAVMGLRSMYFLLAGILPRFHKLQYGLSGILIFVGMKMIAAELGFKIHTVASLGVIALALAGTIVWSLLTEAPPVIEAAGDPADEESTE
jgi:tellurite resistance protein TerC